LANASVGLVVFLCGCSATTSAHQPALYELSSADVGVPWHLHARDGELVCELPCDARVAERSGDYVVVHDDAEPLRKPWRLDLPSSPTAEHVLLVTHVGKGSPALGTLGAVATFGGSTVAFAGIGIGLVTLFQFFVGSTGDNTQMQNDPRPTWLGVGAIMTGVGALLAVTGLYLIDHNKAATIQLHVLPR